MTKVAGLYPTGLVILSTDEIKTQLETSFKSQFGESIDLDGSGPFGQLIGILADREATLWELLVDIKETFNPDGATGLQLDELSALTGTVRDGARRSVAVLSVLGDSSTEVISGSLVSTGSTSVVFSVDSDVTLSVPDAWVTATQYNLGEFTENAGNIYEVIVAGVSTSIPTGTGLSIADGTVTWTYLATETGVASVTATAVDTGALVALSRDISEIDTPITGWNTVINVEDVVVGAVEESDAELRAKRVIELSAGSTSTYGGLFAAVLGVPNVTLVYIFENNTGVTDADGVPAKSFEVLVIGGTDNDLAVTIFNAKPIGIQPFGVTTVNLTDSQGTIQTVGFTRPTDINVYVTVDLIINIHEYPTDGDAQVRDAILALNGTTVPGKDVVSSKIKSICHGIPGVLDVVTAYIGTTVSPASETTITINLRDLADFDSSRTVITTTPGTP